MDSRLCDLLKEILNEQRKTNALLARIRDDSARQREQLSSHNGQADILMQQAMRLLAQHGGT